MTKTFRNLIRGVDREKDDCAIIAIALLTGYPYFVPKESLQILSKIFGDGATDDQIHASLRILGHRLHKVDPKAKTIRTFARQGRKGKYLVTTSDHVVAVIDGVVEDDPKWGDLMRIETVHKIRKRT